MSRWSSAGSSRGLRGNLCDIEPHKSSASWHSCDSVFGQDGLPLITNGETSAGRGPSKNGRCLAWSWLWIVNSVQVITSTSKTDQRAHYSRPHITIYMHTCKAVQLPRCKSRESFDLSSNLPSILTHLLYLLLPVPKSLLSFQRKVIWQ